MFFFSTLLLRDSQGDSLATVRCRLLRANGRFWALTREANSIFTRKLGQLIKVHRRKQWKVEAFYENSLVNTENIEATTTTDRFETTARYRYPRSLYLHECCFVCVSFISVRLENHKIGWRTLFSPFMTQHAHSNRFCTLFNPHYPRHAAFNQKDSRLL